MKRNASLLVVDDNDLNRDVLSRLLKQRGYKVSLAADGEAALAEIASRKYDLVLLDVEMPGMSGLDVLKQVRQRHTRVDLPIIMVTARAEAASIVRALDLGANDYVTKPVDFPVAIARIATHLAYKTAVATLRESEERYALAFQGANDGLWDWDLTANTVHWSDRWMQIVGCDGSTIGSSPEDWLLRVHPDDAQGVREALNAHLGGTAAHFESEHRILHSDQTYRWVRCRGAAIRDSEGYAVRVVGSLTDVTESKVADGLTGLPNRTLFMELIDQALRHRQRHPDYRLALLMLGLSRFRSVSESLGLLTTDRLLVAVAERLQACQRTNNSFTIARLGGDEFAVLIEDVADARQAMTVADALRSSLQAPFNLDGREVFTSAAVGITLSGTAAHTADELLRDAVIALNRAKADGSSGCEIFDPAMREAALTRLVAENDLRHALEHDQFVVHYQPIVCLKSGAIVSFEALVRWRHPSRGLVGPTTFIPLAEEAGILADIDRLTLLESCRRMNGWRRQFGDRAPRTISVNVSSRRFAQGDLVAEVKGVLRETGLPASNLKLEITEGAFIADLSAAEQTLLELHALGVQWSLDDFGTGYSSLSYLSRLPVDTLKLDRSFVSRIGLEHGGSEMVRAIVALSHTLDIEVIGEGVETERQAAALTEFGCEYAQGYLFAKAFDATAVERVVAKQPWQFGTRAEDRRRRAIRAFAS